MDYMGKLLRVRSWKARNALLLVLGMLGQKRIDSTYAVELDPGFLNGISPPHPTTASLHPPGPGF